MQVAALRSLALRTAVLTTIVVCSVEGQELDKGYPKDGVFHKLQGDIIKVNAVEKHHDTFGWTPKNASQYEFIKLKAPKSFVDKLKAAPVILPNVTTKATGNWQLVVPEVVNQRTATDDLPFTYETSLEFSKEMAHEVSVGVEVSGTGAVKPFGVGFELTVSASAGYAFSYVAGETRGQAWTAQYTVKPGKRLQVWQRQMVVDAGFNPKTMFEQLNAPEDYQRREEFWPETGRGFGYTPQDAFLVTMADSYADVLWPNWDYKSLQRDARQLASFNRGKRGGYVSHMRGHLASSAEPGYGSKWAKLQTFFSYEGFQKIKRIELSYTFPTPSPLGTRSTSPVK